jgi:hypothetical protein
MLIFAPWISRRSPVELLWGQRIAWREFPKLVKYLSDNCPVNIQIQFQTQFISLIIPPLQRRGRGYTVLSLCLCVTNLWLNFLNNYSSQALNFSTLFVLACNMLGFISVQIRCKLPVYPCICLFIRVSVCRAYNKFSSLFSQQLIVAEARNFSTLFVSAFHVVGFIFVWIQCQLPVRILTRECIFISEWGYYM